MFNNKNILITGGTGSFGNLFIETVLKKYKPKKLIVFSRDELKQSLMAQEFPIEKYSCMRYFVGYVRDRELLDQLVKNSFAYFHGHEFGGTNPTLVEALSNNAKILALDTVFTREVLDNNKYGLFFDKKYKSVKNLIDDIEKNSNSLLFLEGKGVNRIKERYNWARIINLYSTTFKSLM